MENYSITVNQIDLMKHCIGLDNSKPTGVKCRKYAAYRNYFTDSQDNKEWDNLVIQELAIKRDQSIHNGTVHKYYKVSQKGKELLQYLLELNITGV